MYADTVLLFHDAFGGDRIGAVWQPALRSARPFRALGGFSSTPTHKVGICALSAQVHALTLPAYLLQDAAKGKDKDKGLVVLNERALFAEVQRLGSTLVAGIAPQGTS